MAMGGVIGTGIFKGSAETIGLAGPGVILTYLFGGLLLLVVMGAIAELASVYPNRNMKDFVRQAFGPRPAFIVGWLYAFLMLSVCVIEVTAAGSFLRYWMPGVPLWALSLASAALILGINRMSVESFGETEFWLAGIKIVMIIVFIILGAGLLFGVIPGTGGEAPGLVNYTAHGGFLPNGWLSIFSALLVVMFSYGGSELIGLTLTEAKDAEKVMPKVVKSFILRVILFYTLPILVICGLIPWDELAGQASPFVQVLEATGLAGAAHIMNFILVTAVLSAANSSIYGATRMLHSMAAAGEAPKSLAATSAKGVPTGSLRLCAVVLLLGALIAFFAGDNLFPILLAVPGFVVLVVWLSICLAQLKLRPQYPTRPTFAIWGFPYVTALTALVLAVIAAGFVVDPQNRLSIGVCVGVLLLLIVWSVLKFKKSEA
ncbi:amino acid permease [Saccharibacillus sp. CPCC 101409]|uniref:amino acid permease n=1 Tax=Saccharibacillus sp. CPCC 101409 TaxID=3058041 RepID=UPI002671681E|nr:amino acid permease [Saccharibacillus sp. CPCC 101409]MDO3410291.1 amino acid permease [Saccharibacillus sp. CPCC 101409]